MADFNPINTIVGQTPTGETQTIKVPGDVFVYEDKVSANSAIESNWIDTSGFASVTFLVVSNKIGKYTLEFRNEPDKPSFYPVISTNYGEQMLNTPRQGAINPRLRYVKFVFYLM